jgi:hypothetical protein
MANKTDARELERVSPVILMPGLSRPDPASFSQPGGRSGPRRAAFSFNLD